MSTTTAPATFAQVLDYITTSATRDEVKELFAAGNTRVRALLTEQGRATAAALAPGAKVTLRNIKPKYFDGLTGTVVRVTGEEAVVELDEASTATLRIVSAKYRSSITGKTFRMRFRTSTIALVTAAAPAPERTVAPSGTVVTEIPFDPPTAPTTPAFRKNQKVTITGGGVPCLIGLTGVVEKVNRKTVNVRLDAASFEKLKTTGTGQWKPQVWDDEITVRALPEGLAPAA